MPDAGILATLLLVVGLFLLGLEFFIPSFGMIGILAGLSLVISFWSANKAWGGGQHPTFFWTYVLLLLAGIPGTVFGSFYAIQHTGLGRAIVLQPPSETVPSNPLEALIGKTGVAQTLLTPGGMVTVDRERYHAESVGMMVEPGTPVVVTAVSGNRLVVTPAQVRHGKNPPDRAVSEMEQVIGAAVTQIPAEAAIQSDEKLETALAGEPARPDAETTQDPPLDFEIPDEFRS